MSAAQGGFLTLDQADAGTQLLFRSEYDAETTAFGLLWVESLLFPASTNNDNLASIGMTVAWVAKDEGRTEDALSNLFLFVNYPEEADAGSANLLTQGALDAELAAGELVGFGLYYTSPVDYQFTPNYAVVGMARALGVFWLYQSVQQVLLGPQGNFVFVDVLPQLVSDVSQCATKARARAATRCTEQPVSPVCQTVANYESQTIAPALERLAAQMLLVADAGPH